MMMREGLRRCEGRAAIDCKRPDRNPDYSPDKASKVAQPRAK